VYPVSSVLEAKKSNAEMEKKKGYNIFASFFLHHRVFLAIFHCGNYVNEGIYHIPFTSSYLSYWSAL
jgi:hypothetical protein